MFAAKQQGVDLSKIRREALAFMEGKDGQKEFPEIRFSIDGIEVWFTFKKQKEFLKKVQFSSQEWPMMTLSGIFLI